LSLRAFGMNGIENSYYLFVSKPNISQLEYNCVDWSNTHFHSYSSKVT